MQHFITIHGTFSLLSRAVAGGAKTRFLLSPSFPSRSSLTGKAKIFHIMPANKDLLGDFLCLWSVAIAIPTLIVNLDGNKAYPKE